MASTDNDDEASVASFETPLAQVNNHLAVNLYKLLAKEKQQNIVFSPLSISTALALLYLGATKETRLEMEDALRFSEANLASDSDISSSFRELFSNLESSPDFYCLTFDTAFLLQKDMTISGDFKTILSESFRSFLLEVDFSNESKKISHQINNWVNESTREQIPEILDWIDGGTAMAMLNAVYFKGSWMQQFSEQSTYLECFYSEGQDNGAQEVEMMHLEEFFLYVEKESFKALQLPFKGEEMAVLLLLPHSRNGLEDIENMLTPTFLQSFREEMHLTKVDVELPKFRLEYSKPLKETLQSLGMARVFQRSADLPTISHSNKVKISEILHRAVLEVNEEGCTAATSSAVLGKVESSDHPNFLVDHPFIFAIYDTRSDLILFLGKVDQL